MSNDLIERHEIPQDTHPMSIISRAVERGIDPEQLSRLMDLQERYEANEARKAYNVAMKACQEEMPIVVKNAENKDNRARYSTLDNVLNTVKATFTKYGFSLSFGSETDSATPNHIVVTCNCMHVGGHTEKFSLHCPYDSTGMKGGATKTAIQGMGSAVSYGRRYLVYMIFNLTVADEDDDGNAGGVNKISEHEADELDHWLSQLNADDQERFLAYMGVEKLGDIVASDWGKALSALQRKVKANQK